MHSGRSIQISINHCGKRFMMSSLWSKHEVFNCVEGCSMPGNPSQASFTATRLSCNHICILTCTLSASKLRTKTYFCCCFKGALSTVLVPGRRIKNQEKHCCEIFCAAKSKGLNHSAIRSLDCYSHTADQSSTAPLAAAA